MKLKAINIAVVAPTGAGKTALISTICDYIKKNSNKAKGFTLRIANKAAEELKDFATNLEGQLAAKNMNFDSGLIKGTSECTEYEFEIVFCDANNKIEVAQPFKILDIPGSFINNPTKYEDDSEYKKFIEHLDMSRILWVPIDAAVLMEVSTDNEKGYSQIVRRVGNLSDFVIEWAQFAAENKELDYCDFVLVKSETYFSQDIKHIHKNCITRFDESYGSLVKGIKEINSTDKIACVAVETIGSVKVTTASWEKNNNEANCKVEYQVSSSERQIRGADSLLYDALKVAKENVEKEISILQAEKEYEIDKLDTKKQELLHQLQNKKMELIQRRDDLVNSKTELEIMLNDLDKKTFIDKFFNFFDGNIDKLKEKIKRTKATIDSTNQKIEDVDNDISRIDGNVVITDNEIRDTEAYVAGCKSLISQMEMLGNQNKETEYYRSL